MFSSEPISPLMEGRGSALDDEGRGSLISFSAGGYSFRCAGITTVPCANQRVGWDGTGLGPRFGVSLWRESGVPAPSPLSTKLDSEEELSGIFL